MNPGLMYADALRAIKNISSIGPKDLMKKLNIGYALAARLLDVLEDRGVVGPANENNQRKVL